MRRFLNSNKKSFINLILAFVIVLIFVFTFVSVDTAKDINNINEINSSTLALSSAGFSSTTSSSSYSFNGINIALNQSLKKIDGGKYELTLSPDASSGLKDYSQKNTNTQYGYFEAKVQGDYVFEIWGGNGADGQASSMSDGGKGGKGGYIYSVLEMNQGDYIFYTIGGNGQQSKVSNVGGGANGDGGDHGDTGHFYTGGGGGYTAIYYFTGSDATSFKTNYLDSNGNLTRSTVIENDRLKKYILIAGGGGGGGAGNELGFKAVRTPDGGNAGTFSSASGELSNGFFYAGENGKSSGKKQDYVGEGGTDIPGEEKSGYFDVIEGKPANDWVGTQNSSYPGGSGGAGNLRGGGGGAGYCGGSGGLMTNLVLGTNVGGGGGGSSFVSNISNLSTSLSAKQQSYLTGKDGNTSTTGGAVYISFIPKDEDINCVKNLTISNTISSYFTIDSCKLNDSTTGVTVFGQTFTVSGVNALADTSDKIVLTLTPKTGFMGGNDVKIFTSDNVEFGYIKNSTQGTFNILMDDSCAYVNIPYAFTPLTTHDYSASITGDAPYTGKIGSDLYDAITHNVSNTGYEFISSVSGYSIKDENGKTYGTSDTLSIKSTTKFIVSYTVTPKVPDKPKAVVGDRLETKTFNHEATITITLTGENYLNGNEMTVTKGLAYDKKSGVYSFSVNVETSGTYYISPIKPDQQKYEFGSTNSGSYTIPESGIYFLEVWGGQGGDGGPGKRGEDPGTGGLGGYIGKWVHLEKGTIINWELGKTGDYGKQAQSVLYAGDVGQGGSKSTIKIAGIDALIAGGGGGAKGGTTSSDSLNGFDVKNEGTTGTDGLPEARKEDMWGSTVKDDERAAGTNYINSSLISQYQSGYSANPSATSRKKVEDKYLSSAVYITCLSTDGYYNQTLSDYGVIPTFTNNFKLIEENPITVSGTTSKSISGVNVSEIVIPNPESGNTKYVDFTVTYKLKAVDTCWGGNDIKLLDSLKITQVDKNGDNTDDVIYVKPKDDTDYANVEFNSGLLGKLTLTAKDQEYLLDSSNSIGKFSLYTFSSTFKPSETDAIEVINPYFDGTVNDYLTPSSTTSYKVICGFRAKNTATKAKVCDPITSITKSVSPKITVYAEVSFGLTGVTVSAQHKEINSEDVYYASFAENYSATFNTTESNKVVRIDSVKINGAEYKDYTYDITTGTISIKKEDITGNISINASQNNTSFNLYYVAATNVDGTEYNTYGPVTVEAGKSGEDFKTILDDLTKKYSGNQTLLDQGYEYYIEYPDDTKLTEMPAQNTWIFGCYTPKKYTLTIQYQDGSGDTLSPSVVLDNSGPGKACYYGMDFSIESPQVLNYAPSSVKIGDTTTTSYNPSVVSGKMPNSHLVITVVYESTLSKVIVTYIMKDGTTAPDRAEVTKGIGEAYSIESPTVIGYTPSIATVSGTMPTDNSGVSQKVYYTPNKYEVTFDSDGGSTCAKRYAFYNQDFGYTGSAYDSTTYEPLPTPVRVGYVFEGWYILSNEITEETKFKSTKNVELTAVWTLADLTDDVLTITYSPKSTEYTGNEITLTSLEVKLTDSDTVLRPKMDYTVAYLNNTNVGDATVTITFKGKYKGSVNKTFAITKATAEITVDTTTITKEYGESFILPTATSTFGTVSCDKEVSDMTALGTYTVTYSVADDSNYNGSSKSLTVKIIAKELEQNDLTVSDVNAQNKYTYNGSKFEPTPTVKYGSVPLVLNTDYSLDYEDNTDVGTAKIIITFINNYSGEVTKEFTIEKDTNTVSNLTITGWTYKDSENSPSATSKYESTNISYTYSTEENGTYTSDVPKNAGTYWVKATSNETKNYDSHYLTKSFKIEKYTILENKISVVTESKEYTGSQITQSPKVTFDGDLKYENVDYTLSFGENKNAATNGGSIEITLIGNYTCATTKTVNFDITQKEVGLTWSSLIDEDLVYTGTEKVLTATATNVYTGDTCNVTVKVTAGKSNINVGKFTYTAVSLTNANYTLPDDVTSPEYEITKKSSSSDDISVSLAKETFVYTGSEITPEVVVKDKINGSITVVLKLDPDLSKTDYTLSYSKNTEVGKANVTITFKNNYSGSIDKEFTIVKDTNTFTSNLSITGWTYKDSQNSPSATSKYETTAISYTYSSEENGTYIETVPTNAGTYWVKATSKGTDNYDSSTQTKSFEIKKYTILENKISVVAESKVYTGSQITQLPKVTFDDSEKTKDIDYTLSFGTNINAGTDGGTILVTLIGNYTCGTTKIVYFDIKQKEVGLTWTPSNANKFVYSGFANVLTATATGLCGTDSCDVNVNLTDGKNNVNVGKFTYTAVSLTNANYKLPTNATSEEYEIIAKSSSSDDINVSLGTTPFVYNGSQITPNPVVTFDGSKKTKDVDYILSFGENKKAASNGGSIEITLIGNYSCDTTKTVYFDIIKKEVGLTWSSLNAAELVYTGTAKELTATATGLCGTDTCLVTVKVSDGKSNINVGTFTYEATTLSNSNYALPSNVISSPYTITQKSSSSSDIIVSISKTSFEYTGSEITPEVVVKDNNTTLDSGTHYTVSYNTNINVCNGKAQAVVTFIGNYSGTETKYFSITQKEVGLTWSSLTAADLVYTGTAKELTATATGLCGTDTCLVTVKVSDGKSNINVGTFTYEATTLSNSNYALPSNVISSPYTITQKSSSSSDISVSLLDSNFEYTSFEVEPTVIVIDKINNVGTVLEANRDYEITYQNNVDACNGKAQAVVTFIGNYSGTETKYFSITQKEVGLTWSSLTAADLVYTGTAKELTATATGLCGTDTCTIKVEVSAGKNNINVGKFTFTAVSLSNANYKLPSNVTSGEFEITKKSTDGESDITISLTETSFVYTGSNIFPEVIVSDKVDNNVKTLTQNIDYTISCSDNINVCNNTAKVLITFIGNYSGSETKYFSITQKEAGLTWSSLTAAELVYTGTAKELTATATGLCGTDTCLVTVKVTDGKSNINVGTFTYEATTLSNSNYALPSNVISSPYTITQKSSSSSDISVSLNQITFEYAGSEITPEVVVKDNNTTLDSGTHYTVSYNTNINVCNGKAQAVVTFIGNYAGTETKYFSITQKEVGLTWSSLTAADLVYTGTEKVLTAIATGLCGTDTCLVTVRVTDGKDNVNIGKFTYIATELSNSNYKLPSNVISLEYEITSKELTDPEIIIEVPDEEGELPEVIVKDEDGNILEEGKDYTLEFEPEDLTGKGKVKVQFKDNYTGEKEKEYLRVGLEFDMSSISFEDEVVVYDGNVHNIAIKGELPVGNDGSTLSVSYTEGKVEVGVYEVVATFTVSTGRYKAPAQMKAKLTINSSQLSSEDSKKDEEKQEKPEVIISADNGFNPDITISVELKAVTSEEEKNDSNYNANTSRFEHIGGVYDIKLLRNGVEVQPSEIELNAIYTLKIKVPDEIKGKNIRILHVHSADDITVITLGKEAGIGTYIYDEEGYIVTKIDRLSEFGVIYEEDCHAHWFMIIAFILLLAVILYVLFVLKKQAKKLGFFSIIWFVLINIVALCFAHCTVCWVFTAFNVVLLIAAIIFFLKYKGKVEEEQKVEPQIIEKIVYVDRPVEVQVPVADTTIAEADTTEETTESVDEETIEETTVEEVKEEEPVVEEPTIEEELSLSDSMAKAQELTQKVLINKEVVATWLEDNYKDVVTVNRRENFTSTGLPLADTHYIDIDGKNKCFIYVYEVENNCFFLVRSNNEIVADIKSNHPIYASAFPKTRDNAKWFTMLIDDSYKTNEEVFDELEKIIALFYTKKEEEKLSLNESIAKAQETVSSFSINKELIANYLESNYKDIVEVNRRGNLTSTGLPLADTHYMDIDGKKKCFIYVYEVENRCFLLVRANDDVVYKIKKSHPIYSSAFPKTRDNAKWYTMLMDDSYKTKEDVYKALDIILCRDVIEEDVQLSLNESIAKAQETVSSFSINKELIANYLESNYKDIVEVNRRGNLTSTGLPLADTHYMNIDSKNKCFIYVYEVENGCFLLARANDDVVSKIKKSHPIYASAFPKTRDNAKWFTMLMDDSYKTKEDVYNALDIVIGRKEIAEENQLSLSESMAIANETIQEVVINKDVVANFLEEKYKGIVTVNRRENFTKTGLPLADTHYIDIDGKNKCFIYVYEVDGNTFFLVRSDKNTVSEIKKSHPIYASAFPKTKDNANWYTMLLDDSYKTTEEVLDQIALIISRINKPLNDGPQDDLSLRESIAKAAETKKEVKINKEVIANWLASEYKDVVTVNTRGNLTSTGLPLADTHYIDVDGKNKCFIYVYEIDEKCFFIVRSDNNTVSEIKKSHPIYASAFPKTKDNGKWFTMILDDSYESNDDIFEALTKVINAFTINNYNLENLTLNESMAKASESVQEIVINKKVVVDWLEKNYKDSITINTRGNLTSTGLPLADTHYIDIQGKNKCFMYVYEINNSTFFLIRGDEESISKIKKSHPIYQSAFPKTKDNAKWYTMILDNSYKSNDEIFDSIKMIIDKIKIEDEECKKQIRDYKSPIEELIDSIN